MPISARVSSSGKSSTRIATPWQRAVNAAGKAAKTRCANSAISSMLGGGPKRRRSCSCPSVTRSVPRGGEELAQAIGFRVGEGGLRLAGFLDLSLMQEDDVARDLAGEGHLVGDHQHGATFLGELAH